ncbi:hypothetical protein BQ8482_111769 [Mesorhizobium delmotii]|uniref:Uncharacterized protein n=1 Tax=Mesorhizobium delmotii TaxID=1631247 RepID=A0A2P9AFD3_9HYPH|nr:hypothetical protein BQ8482_111769 [Mesorhizobium delmotii]
MIDLFTSWVTDASFSSMPLLKRTGGTLPDRILHSEACLRQNSTWPTGMELRCPVAMAPDTTSAEAFSIGVADIIKPNSRPARSHARGITNPIRPAQGNDPKQYLISRYHLFTGTSTQPTHNLQLRSRTITNDRMLDAARSAPGNFHGHRKTLACSRVTASAHLRLSTTQSMGDCAPVRHRGSAAYRTR